MPRLITSGKKKAAQAAFFFSAGFRRSILFFLLVGWLIPNHYYPWTAAWGEGATITLFLIFVASILKAPDRGLPLPSRPLVLIFLACAVTCLLQWLIGRILFRGDFFLPLFYLSLWVMAVSVGTKLSRVGDATYLYVGILIFATLSSLLALMQWLGLDGLGAYLADLPSLGRPYANLAQPNNFSTACFLGLSSVTWLFCRKRIGPIACALLIFLLCVGLVLSGSRTGWLQILGSLAFLLYLRRRGDFTSAIRVFFGVLLVCAFLRIALPAVGELILVGNIRPVEELAKPGLRLEMWHMAFKAIIERPWIGYGWQQGQSAQQQVALEFPYHYEHFEHAHNTVLDLIIWNGVLVGVLVCGVWSFWFLSRLRALKKDDDILAFLIITGLMVHAMFEYPLDYSYFLLPFGLAMGIADHKYSESEDFVAPLRISRALMPLVGCFTVVMFLGISIEYLNAESRMRDLRLESYGIGPNPPVPGLAGYVMLDHLDHYMDFIATPASPKMAPDALERMKIVARRFGYAPALMRYALAAGLNGKSEEALRSLELICHIHVPERCREAVKGWAEAKKRWSVLPDWRTPRLPPYV